MLSKLYPNHQLFEVASCRYGIEVIIRAASNKRRNKENPTVAVQAYTCQVVENAILLAGCEPRYIDINLDDWSLSIDEVKALIEKANETEEKQLSALILQHTYGITPHKRQAFIDLCRDRKIPMIEDVAHVSLLNKYQIKTLEDSEYFAGSFQTTKSGSAFQGGIIGVRKDKKEVIKRLKNILNDERQRYSWRLIFCQLVDLLLQTVGIPYSRARYIRNRLPRIYKGFACYERNLDEYKLRKDFIRRGKANLITKIGIRMALRRMKAGEKTRTTLQREIASKIPLHPITQNQIMEGNILLMWPISELISKEIEGKMNKWIIHRWFNPKIYPSTRYSNNLNSCEYEISSQAESNAYCLSLGICCRDRKKIVNMLSELKTKSMKK